MQKAIQRKGVMQQIQSQAWGRCEEKRPQNPLFFPLVLILREATTCLMPQPLRQRSGHCTGTPPESESSEILRHKCPHYENGYFTGLNCPLNFVIRRSTSPVSGLVDIRLLTFHCKLEISRTDFSDQKLYSLSHIYSFPHSYLMFLIHVRTASGV
jgi:hypothetical protein